MVRLITVFVCVLSLVHLSSAQWGYSHRSRNRNVEAGKTFHYSPYNNNRRFVNPCKDQGRSWKSVNVYNIYYGPCKGVLGDAPNAIQADPVVTNTLRPVRGGSALANFLSLFVSGPLPVAYTPTANRPFRPIQTNSFALADPSTTTFRPFALENNEVFNKPVQPLSELAPDPEMFQNNRPLYTPSTFPRPPLPSSLSESSLSGSFINNNRPLLTNPFGNGGFGSSSGSVSGNGFGSVSTSVTNNGVTISNQITSNGGDISSSISSNGGDVLQKPHPVYEDSDGDTSPPEYNPFGQQVGGVAQSVGGFFQSLVGDTDIPGRAFFRRWFG